MAERQRFGRGGQAQQDENPATAAARFGRGGNDNNNNSSSSSRADDRGDKPPFGSNTNNDRGNPPFGGRQQEPREETRGFARDPNPVEPRNPFGPGGGSRDQASSDRAPFGNRDQNSTTARPNFGSRNTDRGGSHDNRSGSNNGDQGDNRGNGGLGSRSSENTASRTEDYSGRMRSDDAALTVGFGRANGSSVTRDSSDNRGSYQRDKLDNRDSREDSRGSVAHGSGDQHHSARPPFANSTNLPHSTPAMDDNQQKAKEAQEKCKKAASEINKVLLETRDFSDVVLVPEDGVEVRAHKVILAARSALFRDIFFGPAKTAAAEEEKPQVEEKVDADATAEVASSAEDPEGELSDHGEADEEKAEDSGEKEKEVVSETEEGEVKDGEKPEVDKEENGAEEAEQVKAVPKKKKKKAAKAVPKEEAVKAEPETDKINEAVPERVEQVKAVSTHATAQTDAHEEVNRLEIVGNFSKKVLEIFLEFIYKGESTNCSQDEMHLVFLLASKYKVDDVRDLAALELTKNITGETFVKLLMTASEESSVVMKQKVMDFIVKERKTVLAREDFKNLRTENNPLYVDILENLALH